MNRLFKLSTFLVILITNTTNAQHIHSSTCKHNATECSISSEAFWSLAPNYGISDSQIKEKKSTIAKNNAKAEQISLRKSGNECETVVGMRIHYYDDAVQQAGANSHEEFQEWAVDFSVNQFQEGIENSGIDFDGIIVTDILHYADDSYLGNCDFNQLSFNALFGIGEPFATAVVTKDAADAVIDLWITSENCTANGNPAVGYSIINADGNENQYINIFVSMSEIAEDNSDNEVFCHELGHATGGQHGPLEGDIGGNSDGYAFIDNSNNIATTMAPSAANRINQFSKDGSQYGSLQQNAARSLEEDLTEYWANYYEVTTLCVTEEFAVCPGNSFNLDACTNNGDEVEITVVNGNIMISDPIDLSSSISATTSGQIKVRVRNASEGKDYSREKLISINVINCNSSPVAQCNSSFDVPVGANGNWEVTTSDLDNGSFDPDGTFTLSSSGTTNGNCSDVGNTFTVTLIITDNDGATDQCVTTITIVDDTAPTALAQTLTLELDGTGSVSLTATTFDNGSSDNCSIANRSIDVTNFDCDDLGGNTVTLTVTDASGNTATDQKTVTIIDNIAPTLECVVDTIMLQLSANEEVTLTQSEVLIGTPQDNCGDPTVTLTGNVVSGGGNHTVTITAEDSSGNITTCTAIVYIDITNAVIDVSSDPSIKLFPNPTINIITIESGSREVDFIEIHDQTGRLVRRISGESQTDIMISVGELYPGKYITQCFIKNGDYFSLQFIKLQ